MTRQTAAQIEAEAADWLARLDRHNWPSEMTAELDAWLDEDPRRRGAFLQAQAALNLLNDRLTPASGETDTATNLESEEPEAKLPWLLARRRFLIAGGAVAASIAAGTTFLLPSGQSYGTGIGEVRRVPLADGSVVAINTQSHLRVDLKRDVRVVNLTDGEAWFQVAKDRARPFVAEAGPVRVRAVGTAFSVRRRENGADVSVSEGVVEAWVEGAENRKVRLAAGQAAFVADNSLVEAKPATIAEVDRSLAWRNGQIDLAGETIASAIEDFNRYNDRKLVLADTSIADEPLFGVFRTDDPNSFATAIGEGFGVPLKRAPDSIVIGRSAP